MISAPVEAQELEEKPHKRVLVLHSFGRNFSPGGEVSSSFQKELRERAPTPVEFFEASLEAARFQQSRSDEPFVEYLAALFEERPLDLVVCMSGVAARFCLEHRDGLFSATPLLMTGFEKRMLEGAAPLAHATAVSAILDVPGLIENILQLLPNATQIVVIVSNPRLGRLWHEQLQRDFEPFAGRVQFTWFDSLSLEEMRERVADLPADTAIFYGGLPVDAAGVPYDRDEALEVLYAAANAPIFGLHDFQLGRGIVGGPLLSIGEVGRRASEAALRILGGEPPEGVATEPVTLSAPVYDYRELERWGISERVLPAGSTVRFRTPSAWDQHRSSILAAVAIVLLEGTLIAGLLVQRSRREAAERKGVHLSRRLLTAHEDERRRLARELHDDLSQRLARLAIDSGQMEDRLETVTGERAVPSISEDLGRLSEDIHTLSYQLHPSLIEDLGLDEALQVECERFSDVEGIPAELESNGLPAELPEEASLCLFRIAQEALRNVSRHSRASRVRLSLEPANGGVRLVVSDDGVGFDPVGVPRGTSLGYASMRERVSLVDGKLEVESGPGRGTTVTAWVPKVGST